MPEEPNLSNPSFRFMFIRELKVVEEEKVFCPWLIDTPRFYKPIQKDPQRGARGEVYRCVVSDTNGTEQDKKFPHIAVKIPNLEKDLEYSEGEQNLHLFRRAEDAAREFSRVKGRLIGCKYAAPVFDIDVEYDDELRTISKLASLYVANGMPLKEWLTHQHLRHDIDETDQDQKDSWHGIQRWSKWKQVALIIGRALADIHRRRVAHRDVHPGNIFVTEAINPYSMASASCEPYALLIDFGDAFLTTPYGSSVYHVKTNHPYRAPERGKDLYILTERVDVYSFGKVLLYLATGEEKTIPDDRYGKNRRQLVRDRILDRNPGLFKQNPALVDIIARCVSYDPVTRPKMSQIVRELERESDNDHTTQISIENISSRINALTRKVENLSRSDSLRREKMFLRIVDQKLDDIDSLIGEYGTEEIDVDGTRDTLIDSLSVLFNELRADDSWTTLTTPDVWQGAGLGLDGRYASATIDAIRRDASVRRVYAICVQETGTAWASDLAKQLKDDKENVELQKLGRKFDICIDKEIERQKNQPSEKMPSPGYHELYQKMIKNVIESQKTLIEAYQLTDKIYAGDIKDFTKIDKLCLAIIPVATRQELHSLRIKNPVSLIHYRTQNDC